MEGKITNTTLKYKKDILAEDFGPDVVGTIRKSTNVKY